MAPEALARNERRRDGLRDGQPEPRGEPGGGSQVRADRGEPAARTTPIRSTTCCASRDVFRGSRSDSARADDHRADMKMAAAHAIADTVRRVGTARGLHHPVGLQTATWTPGGVAKAVADEARATGAARAGHEVGLRAGRHADAEHDRAVSPLRVTVTGASRPDRPAGGRGAAGRGARKVERALARSRCAHASACSVTGTPRSTPTMGT